MFGITTIGSSVDESISFLVNESGILSTFTVNFNSTNKEYVSPTNFTETGGSITSFSVDPGYQGRMYELLFDINLPPENDYIPTSVIIVLRFFVMAFNNQVMAG